MASSDDDINEVMKKLDILTLSDNWKEMHSWITEYRREKHLTLRQFLKACQLDVDNCYYHQLACKTGVQMRPSARLGSKGELFRTTVKKFKDAVERGDPEITDGSSISDSVEQLVREWCMDNGDVLAMNGIRHLSVKECNGDDVLLWLSACKELSDEQGRKALEPLIGQLGNKTISLVCTRSELLSTLESPLCIRGFLYS